MNCETCRIFFQYSKEEEERDGCQLWLWLKDARQKEDISIMKNPDATIIQNKLASKCKHPKIMAIVENAKTSL